MKNRRRIYNAPFFFLAADRGPGPKLKFKITRARYRPMNQRERSGEFIAGLPCKYKNGYSQLFDARARAPQPFSSLPSHRRITEIYKRLTMNAFT